ncbi:MAG: DUF4340 domain-containing protein [Leptolyngbyaceae cyanobacterium SL_7_1]|nr:DUF4340 domain-containing protein [Leptolyngbyaceae cyanobacterium SL_7_1]
MFKPMTLVLVSIAVLLGGVVYLAERRTASQTQAEQAGQELFDFQEEQVQSFSIRTEDQSLTFEKVGDTWQLIDPENTRANDASVAYLLNLMATGSIERTLTADPKERPEFGLDLPLANIDVRLENQETHSLILGDYDFSRNFLYAQTNPSINNKGEIEVLLVSPEFENAVDRSLSEWKGEE